MTALLAVLARRRRELIALVACVLLALGLVALHRLTREIRLDEVRGAFDALPVPRLALAAVLTACSYLALTFYDRLALAMIGRPLPWRTAALASFTSYTLSHNLGLAPVTGGSARYRVYTAAGLDGPDIARVIVIAGMTFWMGVTVVAGLALAVHHGPVAWGPVTWSQTAARLAGIAVVASAAVLLSLRRLGIARLSLWGWTVPLPTPRQGLAQTGIAALDLLCASAALFVLIPGLAPDLLPGFVLGYALAIIVVLLSHVPGGIGVFEAVVVATVPAPRAELVAALIAYRVIYYLLPLALGLALLAWREGLGRRVAPALHGITGAVTPPAMATAAFLAGVMLLVSGSLPAVPDRLYAIRAALPLSLMEMSHLGASLVGTGLILLAPGLARRLDGALHGARLLLVIGAALSLLKGIDYEEALACLLVAALLHRTRESFHRSTELVARPLSPAWIVCVAAAVGGSLWVGFFAYKHVTYQDALWWRFAFDGDASRFLRASLAMAVLLVVAGLRHLLGPAAPPAGDPPDDRTLDRIVAGAEHTDAMLALTGDKRFLLSPDGQALLMYQVRGASWIVMGDPVGPTAQWPDLLWRVRALSHDAQARLLLYQVGAGVLEIAVEMGLQIIKYGEEAVVDLATFALDGPAMRSLRQGVRRAERDGASFDLVSAAAVPALMPELARVSDAWLAAKGAREKWFSVGRFDPAYLARFDCAVVRVDGRIVAFANVWRAQAGGELSVDLMRHGEDAPRGTMDFLFAHLMAWGRNGGYRRFSLGLAPLSGIEARRLSPTWAKAAHLLFRRGERLYGFRGLRSYKDKFQPDWEPRYIAGLHGLTLLRALHDLTRLVANGPDRATEAKAVAAPAIDAAGRKRRALASSGDPYRASRPVALAP